MRRSAACSVKPAFPSHRKTDFLVTYLFNDADGVAALKEMDGTIAELPGLGGTHYLSEAAERCAERMGLPFGL